MGIFKHKQQNQHHHHHDNQGSTRKISVTDISHPSTPTLTSHPKLSYPATYSPAPSITSRLPFANTHSSSPSFYTMVDRHASSGAGAGTGAVGAPGTRPSFGQWLKATVLDVFTMFVLGAIGLGVYFCKPAPTRNFPVTFVDGEVVYPQFAYPLRKNIIPIWAAALLAFFVPFVVISICQIRVRSFWDFNNSVIGLLYSLICAALFQVVIKWLIGGLRPHFLDVCKPDLSKVQGTGYNGIMYTRIVCTGDEKEINDSLESFPSGHSTAAFAGFIFLYLYLNAKLKVFSNYHPAMWKLVAIYAPVLGAVLVAGSLTIDEFHNWYDVVAGATIGTVFAFSSYRMVYASIWDFRFNHIPLLRSTAFMYSEGQAEFSSFNNSMWTRKASWGQIGIGSQGAPGDATAGFGGYNHSRTQSHNISRRPVAHHTATSGTENIV